MKGFVAVALLSLGSVCCKMPNTTVQTVDGRSTLKLVGAPAGAVIFLDGNLVGNAEAYVGDPKVLSVEPGTHLVEVKKGGKILVSQRVFFGGGEMRSISIPSEVKR